MGVLPETVGTRAHCGSIEVLGLSTVLCLLDVGRAASLLTRGGGQFSLIDEGILRAGAEWKMFSTFPVSGTVICVSVGRRILINKGDGGFRRNWPPSCNYAKRSTLGLINPFYERRQDMAATSLFTCTCGIQKKTSNHWVLAKVTPAGITFMPWDINLAFDDEIIVLCGERCASALLSRYMGDWKRPSVSVTVNEPELAVA